jgi:hypothetical protein
MVALSVSFGPRTPKTLIEEVGRLPGMVRGLELSMARRAVHRILAMIKSHYQGLYRTKLSGGWAPGIADDQCDELETDCTARLRPRDGRRRVKGSGIAATRRVRGTRSSRAPKLNMPQIIML